MKGGSVMKAKLFSMVEVTLAIAVVGIGITGIMAMFPVAVQSSRDAISQNYIADGVEQLSMVLSTLANNDSNWLSGATVAQIPILSGTPHLNANPSDTGYDGTITSNENACTKQYGTIYLPTGPDFSKGTAVLKMTSTISGTTTTDFSAGIRFWKTPIQNIYLNQQNFSMPDTAYGAGIYMEVSWPAAKPYSQREKRCYYYELYNSNI